MATNTPEVALARKALNALYTQAPASVVDNLKTYIESAFASLSDEPIEGCCEETGCREPAKWVRKTQFAGDHSMCETHAREQGDFGQEDSSYFFWTRV